MVRGATLLAAILVLSASGASAADEDKSGSDEATKEKKICRTEKITGSLTRRSRICLTEAQWRELNDRTRRGVSEMQGSASGAPGCISAMDAACGAPGPGGT